MDTIDTPTTDIVVTDEAVVIEDYSNDSFGKEIAKTLIISTATTAGMLLGAGAVGFAVQKFQQFKTARASKKDTVEGVVIADTIETPQNED